MHSSKNKPGLPKRSKNVLMIVLRAMLPLTLLMLPEISGRKKAKETILKVHSAPPRIILIPPNLVPP
jgi:hypothetical protein